MTPSIAPQPPRRAWWKGAAAVWGLRLGIIAVVLIGAFLLRDRMSGSANDLQVGDCFDEPGGNATEISNVQHRPCNEAHDAEIVFVGKYPDQDAFPGQDAFTVFSKANCIPAFQSYVGRDFETDTILDMGTFSPIADGWKNGDHEITCYVDRVDGTKLTSSVKATGG